MTGADGKAPDGKAPDGKAHPAGADLAALEALSTEELRQRAFARGRARHDLTFFWSVIRHLPHASAAEGLDGSLGAYPASVDDAVALWREFTGHDYGDREPLLRAAFVDYLRGGDPG
ncbi:hypothetical protein GCM10010124_00780 [Pilimelia terevasa]|uniref:Uncharacterized protein n=1 Tax=Pilimelia terevasa TaxID=53372 RepID=A0A8J3BFU8_9ACTN|nr:hypothetical protein [Pilimelia terevasa]GGK11992.1 hypothetical protein GCM10010124_00780 [Pilimelia terevasa]